MTLILVRNNQVCHVKYWCDLSSKAGWKNDLCAEIQLAGFHEAAVISLWAKTCSVVDRRKINSHHVLRSTTICPKQQSHSEGKKSDIKLNVRWIMHVRGKTRLYRYLSDWLVPWQWGSISAPSLTLHSLLLLISNLYISKKVQCLSFSLPLTPPFSGQAGCILQCFLRGQLWTYKDPCLLSQFVFPP